MAIAGQQVAHRLELWMNEIKLTALHTTALATRYGARQTELWAMKGPFCSSEDMLLKAHSNSTLSRLITSMLASPCTLAECMEDEGRAEPRASHPHAI